MVKMTEAERIRKCTMKNKDYISGKCLKKCKEPLEIRDNKTLKCVKAVSQEDICKRDNKDFNNKTRRCVKKCLDTQTRDPTTFKCVNNKTRRSTTPRQSNKPRRSRPYVSSRPLVASPDNIIESISANDLHKSHTLDDLPRVSPNSKNIPKNSKSQSARSLADLKNVCGDSHYCITFGINVDKINQYFGHYLDFNYVTGISKLNEGANGYLLKLYYNRDNYAVSAAIKSTMDHLSNNLAYEYLVGIFINKYNKIFPSFLETYQLLQYKSIIASKRIKQRYNYSISDPAPFKDNVFAIQDMNVNNIGTTCNRFMKLAVLIQYLDNATILVDSLNDLHFVKYELINVLYQVYAPLSIMADVFTHYDLHGSNILLLKPYDDLYIEYIYHYPNGKTVKFNSQYIAKIIDYGYSYFNDTSPSGTNSADILKVLCNEPECGPTKKRPNIMKCGVRYGFDILAGFNKHRFQDGGKRNRSSDLRLLLIMKHHFDTQFQVFSTIPYLKDFVLLLKDLWFHPMYPSTPEDLKDDGKIRNVMQAKNRIEQIMNSFDVRNVNQEFKNNMAKAGTLHIYTDGSAPMKYVPDNP